MRAPFTAPGLPAGVWGGVPGRCWATAADTPATNVSAVKNFLITCFTWLITNEINEPLLAGAKNMTNGKSGFRPGARPGPSGQNELR